MTQSEITGTIHALTQVVSANQGALTGTGREATDAANKKIVELIHLIKTTPAQLADQS